jgi:hypothetical protein
MMRSLLLLGLGFIMAGCGSGPQRADTSGPALSGGDGLTIEHAVVMTGGNEITNTDTEYAWIRRHVPDARVTGQELITHDGRVYDKLNVSFPDGSSRSYYFDITSGFGKLPY